jgi:hypothetical protein
MRDRSIRRLSLIEVACLAAHDAAAAFDDDFRASEAAPRLSFAPDEVSCVARADLARHASRIDGNGNKETGHRERLIARQCGQRRSLCRRRFGWSSAAHRSEVVRKIDRLGLCLATFTPSVIVSGTASGRHNADGAFRRHHMHMSSCTVGRSSMSKRPPSDAACDSDEHGIVSTRGGLDTAPG